MTQDLIAEAQPKLQKAFEFLSQELKTLRTGRANPTLVENIEATVYDQPMQIKQLASIATPDAKSITVSPWDVNNIEAIEKAIREDKELGLNPVNDGRAIHINVPPLTTERREQLVKQVGEKVENCYISLRNVRHDILDKAKRMQKENQISEDDYHRIEKLLTSRIDDLRDRIEELADTKKQELREI